VKRVVVLSGVYPNMRCGVAPHTHCAAQAVADTGSWDVHVLTSADDAIDGNLAKNYRVHPVIGRWNLRALPGIVREIERLRPDVLHVQTPTAAYAGRMNFTMPLLPLAGKRLWNTVRLVVTQHDLAIGHRLMQLKHGMLLKRAAALTVSNDRDYQAVCRLSPELLKRTYVAHLASHFNPPELSESEIAEVRRGLGVPEGAMLLLYFGFIVPGRRLETLVSAAGLLREQGRAFRLVLMGGPGAGADRYMEQCRALAVKLGLDKHVVWAGHVEPAVVEKTVAAADMLISPIARGADLRNSSLFPAIRAGLPILTTENPKYSIDRELRAWDICRFFDPGSPPGLADAIVRLHEDAEAKRRMRENTAALAKRLTWQEHARILDFAYRGEPPEAYEPASAAGKGTS